MKTFKDFIINESKRQEMLSLAFMQIYKKLSKKQHDELRDLILKGDNESLNKASQMMDSLS